MSPLHGIIFGVVQSLCVVLFAAGIFFIFFELRAKLDRSFALFGISLILLCLFASIDIWIQPLKFSLRWTELQHVIICFIPPTVISYLLCLLKKPNPLLVRILFIVAGLISIPFVSHTMLFFDQGAFKVSFVYYLTFLPYIAGSVVYFEYVLIKSYSAADSNDRRVLLFHLIGWGILLASGFTDWGLFLMRRFLGPLPSISIFGVLALGFITSYIFIDRLIHIVLERQENLQKLRSAYRELEEARSLSELGKSTAIINHEIRNYTCAISGFADMLKRKGNLNQQSIVMVDGIISSVVRITNFSKEILEFSKSKIIREKQQVDIGGIISTCIQKHFPSTAAQFKIDSSDARHMIHGDWGKLEQVFVNLFRNSFEAGASTIAIRISRNDHVLVITLEDDGGGCTAQQLENIGKAFYSTKNGTGLGTSISRSIIESHGGRISIVSKNLFSRGEHGLIQYLTFPAFLSEGVSEIGRKDKVVLITEKIEPLNQVIRVFQNVNLNPYLVQHVSDFKFSDYPSSMYTLLGHPDVVNQVVQKDSLYRHFSLVKTDANQFFAVCNSPHKEIQEIFSEEFVISMLRAH